MINNFRTRIKDTNQILNQNISPGLLIIPSELTILKNPIPGYNNAITTSTQNMKTPHAKPPLKKKNLSPIPEEKTNSPKTTFELNSF